MPYGLSGNTLTRIVEVFQFHLRFPLTAGGLIHGWHSLRELLTGWYDEIAERVKSGAVLHGDETGWRVNGETHWLWCVTNADATYDFIDPAAGRRRSASFSRPLTTASWSPTSGPPTTPSPARRSRSACRTCCAT